MQWLRARIPYPLAGRILLAAMLLLLLLHLLVFAGVLPGDILWGGQVTDESTLLLYEIVALAISLLFLVIVAARLEFITARISQRLLTIGLWLMAAYFLINTVGNLASSITLETVIFTPITLALAVLAIRVAIE